MAFVADLKWRQHKRSELKIFWSVFLLIIFMHEDI